MREEEVPGAGAEGGAGADGGAGGRMTEGVRRMRRMMMLGGLD